MDPAAGRVTFAAFATAWLAAQTFDASTREAVASRLRVHLLPAFGNVEIRHIRPSMVQAWLRDRQERAAPRSVRVLLANLSGILGAAVEDGLIARNPCASKAVRAPAVEQDRIIPWTLERVVAVVAAHPARWRALPLVATGCGLRQGEVFGLRVEDVDFLRHRVLVRQQVKLLGGRPMIAPPKGRKTREVPLPEMVAAALAEHLRATPAIDGLVFKSREHKLVNRNYFNHHVWKPALRAAGVEPTRANGMHALRHFYASVQLEAGTSVRALAEYLGHADPGFTLRVYTHLMPTSESRARQAVDEAFADALDTAPCVTPVSRGGLPSA
ncbi:MAG: tyrosine-type recombinase/integrase [Acidimicrobiales bacterium]